MKTIYYTFIFFSVMSLYARANDTIRLTNGEWPPWLSQELKYYGLASRIVTEAFKLEGIQVEYGFFPWARSKALAEKGLWDGSIVWNKNPAREKRFYFSDPIIDGKFVFFHLKSFPFDWKQIDDLKNYAIGATLEYNYGKAFMAAEAQGLIKVKRLPQDELNFAKLLKGRIQLFPIQIDVGYDMLEKNFSPNDSQKVTHHPKPLLSPSYYMLISKKIDSQKALSFIKKFHQGLKRLKASGKYDQFVMESRRGDYKLK